MQAIAVETELYRMLCGTCGVAHAIPKRMYETCMREGGFWSCPNGHRRGWHEGAEKTEIKQLQAELAAERQRKEAAIARANEATSARTKAERALTRHKKRTAAGTCPCCKRTFQQLARHIANKHPEYGNG